MGLQRVISVARKGASIVPMRSIVPTTAAAKEEMDLAALCKVGVTIGAGKLGCRNARAHLARFQQHGPKRLRPCAEFQRDRVQQAQSSELFAGAVRGGRLFWP